MSGKGKRWSWSVGIVVAMLIASTSILATLPGSQASRTPAEPARGIGFHLPSGPLTIASPNAQGRGSFGNSIASSGTTVVVGAPGETASGSSDAGHAYVFQAKTGTLIATLTSPNAQTDGRFGYSVAVSGTRVAVGAPDETVSGNAFAGHVYVFQAKTGSLVATLTSPNPQAEGYFGSSVAVSGTTVVVGAFNESASGVYSGHVYVFKDTTPAGTLVATLSSPNAQTDGYFGFSVGASGTTVVVGAPGETVTGHYSAGRAYIFQDAGPTGSLISTLTSPNAQIGGVFGQSVAVSGATVAVGAPYETVSGQPDAGHVYVFQAKTGSLIATLPSPNPQTEGNFGWSVSVSGTTVVVGAPGELVSTYSAAGHAFAFDVTTDSLLLSLASPNAQTDGSFGCSVTVGGATMSVAAPAETVSGYSWAGHAYIYDAKSLLPTLTSPNAQADGAFGLSVATTGTTVVIGAPWETALGYLDAGHVYIFQAKTGTLIATLTSPNAQGDGGFGFSVAISGTTVVVGAPDETASGYADAGRAYVFKDTTPTGTLVATLTSPSAQASGYFGVRVAVSGATVGVGAPGETASGYSEAGHAYTFKATTGVLISTLSSPSPQAYGGFGLSVAVSGTTVVVGAVDETASGYAEAGHAYVLKDTAPTGTLVATLTSPNAQPDGYFGSSVAVSGTTVMIGAVGETASGYATAGHAYVLMDAGPSGTLIATLTSPNAQADGSFGSSAAVSGTTVVVGAVTETASGSSGAGCAYVFSS